MSPTAKERLYELRGGLPNFSGPKKSFRGSQRLNGAFNSSFVHSRVDLNPFVFKRGGLSGAIGFEAHSDRGVADEHVYRISTNTTINRILSDQGIIRQPDCMFSLIKPDCCTHSIGMPRRFMVVPWTISGGWGTPAAFPFGNIRLEATWLA
jgi:hypothetical protein